LIQTEYLFSLDHAPSLALADGTTWWLLASYDSLGCCASCTTDHVLILPAEGLDGISDVSVPFKAFISVVLLRWIPGQGALD
jgi:hypothetical protein